MSNGGLISKAGDSAPDIHAEETVPDDEGQLAFLCEFLWYFQ